MKQYTLLIYDRGAFGTNAITPFIVEISADAVPVDIRVGGKKLGLVLRPSAHFQENEQEQQRMDAKAAK